ncbi:FecCD family ABC transporter permease [Agrococcus baldri]|uniref:ABC transporter permease n=1 Tax=Agrococcus baldri TaxID=153730 RepID=A0AA87RG93_9MICO|nr:iron chelate uptake ABC transporter family permease subunit [Agrococcus baldri]GEK79068.1 ABC transporter permease [Agrococcus baldri]
MTATLQEQRPPAPKPQPVLRIGRALALPFHRRGLAVSLALLAAILLAAVATLSLGSLGIPVLELPAALAGEARATATFALERIRGPRLLVAVGVGILLAISGSLFQTVTRNPLGSPDIIGLGAGAGAGVALATLLLPGLVPAPVGALVGAVVAIGLVWLATGRGFTSPSRVIIAGIGVAAMAHAITQYVVSVALRDEASQLAGYLAGSINSSDWDDVRWVTAASVVVLLLAGLLSGRLAAVELGDDLAASLGVRVDRTRTLAVLLAVLAAAAAVTVAGPIAFVALTAPQIARRITAAPSPPIVATALTGALIMVVADLAAQHLPFAEGLPVGVLTAGVGGVYLGWLLIREWRIGRI